MESKIYRQADNIITRKVLEDILLVPVSGDIAAMDNIFSLNPVGYFIWQQLDGVQSVARICRIIQENFDAPPSVIENDLHNLLAELSGKELIVRVDVPGKSNDRDT